ncbi:efflux RND transporter periplasmic adaptor subunit [Blastopirellula sp. JC732]|uniref:Efflux RND transporter periplasmic adaptor subunit n=1 Tax=Blastopirellula sediminis TaxID=2894196 RepID=A0A9X1MJF4_9BACT|nr:efflux RND transporter periplasmic adaptor subunit [Blastopirellula sediminis]MCC9607907.1 efflux RND transporter periplasmic adaptor subunit [Blastopirellula sediminis]MCC9627300.1 efflux RND transporter periplasmic adaptor subunit [Blastopirellula sediminis]
MKRSTLPLLALLAIGIAPAAQAQMPPVSVRAVPVELRQVQPHHRFTGSLRAVARGSVAALEDGRVLEVTVREGAAVEKGDVIAIVDSRRLEAQQGELQAMLQTAQALVSQREAELRQTKLDLQRSHSLVGHNAISQQEHEHNETEVAVAEARLATDSRRIAEIERQLELMHVRLDDTTVRAPYNAQVIERLAQPGEWIKAGEPFVTLVSTGEIEAWLEIPERYAGVLSQYAEKPAVKIVGSDKQYNATSAKRVNEVHPRTRTFQFVVMLDDAEGELSPGMSVDAWLPIGPAQNDLTVPKDAVVRSGGSTYVYKAVEGEKGATAVRQPIQVKFETGNWVVVEAIGLMPGDMVIIEGNERLFPNTPIAVTEVKGPALQAEMKTGRQPL